MGVLDNLSPGQRQLLMYGAPVVAVFALISVLGKRNQPSTAVATGATQATALPNASAIGVGELATYESAVTAAIGSLQAQVAAIPTTTSTTVVQQIATPAPTPLPPIDHSAYPLVGEPGSQFAVLGSITGPGGIYTGENVSGGAPVYAKINGQWVQNFDPNKLAVGTALATPQQFQSYIVNGTVTEDL